MLENEPQTKTTSEENPRLFFPYYVNQGRLLDIYSILNGGYSEYHEITSAISNVTSNEGMKEIHGGLGFRILNIGGALASSSAETGQNTQGTVTKKVQTIPSILSMVLDELSERQMLGSITSNPSEAMFVDLHVKFVFNSPRIMIDKLEELSALVQGGVKPQQKGTQSKKTHMQKSDSSFETVTKQLGDLFRGIEVIDQTSSKEYVVISSITDKNLYLATRDDLVDNTLQCFCQIKKVYQNGTTLLKNTIFSQIKDEKMKKETIEKISRALENEFYDFGVIALLETAEKPVYEVEIIALYK